MANPMDELAEDFGHLHISPGADLAKQLVAGTTQSNPRDLIPSERLKFFQALVCLTETELHRVIDHVGSTDAFHRFLAEEVNRRRSDADRLFWRARVIIEPTAALNSSLPSESTVANSNSNYVRSPRKLPPVCPAILRCKAFLKFQAALKAETDERLPRLTDFLRTSNQIFDTEKKRCDEVFPFLERWMEDMPGVQSWNGQSKMFAETESKIDIAFFAPALADWPLVIIEYKNEAHNSTKADPVAQATHFYLQQLQASPLRGSFNAPALILQIVGTHVAAYAVIHSGHDRNGPAFAGTHLLEQIDMGVHHTRDDQHQRKINAFWLAVKACVHELVHDITLQLVTDLSRATTDEDMPDEWRPAHVFPWIVRAGSFRFQYVRALGADKMAFLARLQNGKEDEHIVVKFVNHARYAKEAHELLAREGLAPHIYHAEIIDGKWTMLLMQWMEGMKNVDEFKTRHLTPVHQGNEARALDILHSTGFVHGDLRNANVMVDGSGRLCIIDFDWSGEHGKIRYPFVMNSKIQWPQGTEPNGLIEQHHDVWWYEQRYALLASEEAKSKS